MTLCPVRSLPAVSSRRPASVSISVVLPAPVGADQRYVLAALEPQLRVVEQLLVAGRQRRVLELEHHAAAALGRLERERQPGAVGSDRATAARSCPERLARDCAWRARVPARKRVTNRSRRSISACWRSIARPRASSRAAFSRRHACHGPAKNRPRAGLELEHRGADRLQKPAVVGDEHDRRVEAHQVLLEPLERGDVEVVGRLVEQQQVGVAGQRAAERRARQLAARERVAAAGRGRRRRGSRGRAASPARGRASCSRRRARAAPAPRRSGRASPRRGRRRPSPARARPARCSIATSSRRAGQDVLAQRQPAVARRTLVVQRDLGALGQHELADVDRRLAGQHPQQRRLAGAVAARQRHPVAALELERDPAQQRLAGDVLAEVRCDHHRHASDGRCRSPGHAL